MEAEKKISEFLAPLKAVDIEASNIEWSSSFDHIPQRAQEKKSTIQAHQMSQNLMVRLRKITQNPEGAGLVLNEVYASLLEIQEKAKTELEQRKGDLELQKKEIEEKIERRREKIHKIVTLFSEGENVSAEVLMKGRDRRIQENKALKSNLKTLDSELLAIQFAFDSLGFFETSSENITPEEAGAKGEEIGRALGNAATGELESASSDFDAKKEETGAEIIPEIQSIRDRVERVNTALKNIENTLQEGRKDLEKLKQLRGKLNTADMGYILAEKEFEDLIDRITAVQGKENREKVVSALLSPINGIAKETFDRGASLSGILSKKIEELTPAPQDSEKGKRTLPESEKKAKAETPEDLNDSQKEELRQHFEEVKKDAKRIEKESQGTREGLRTERRFDIMRLYFSEGGEDRVYTEEVFFSQLFVENGFIAFEEFLNETGLDFEKKEKIKKKMLDSCQEIRSLKKEVKEFTRAFLKARREFFERKEKKERKSEEILAIFREGKGRKEITESWKDLAMDDITKEVFRDLKKSMDFRGDEYWGRTGIFGRMGWGKPINANLEAFQRMS